MYSTAIKINPHHPIISISYFIDFMRDEIIIF